MTIDDDPPLILPSHLREWVPGNALAHFLLGVVEEIDWRPVRVNERGTGSEPSPPRRMGGDTPPDHDPIGTVGRANPARLAETFVGVWPLAPALTCLPGGPSTVAVEGTPVLAHARKPAAVG